MRSYGYPGPVTVGQQNRITEYARACPDGVRCGEQGLDWRERFYDGGGAVIGKGMQGAALPSGTYRGAVGKVVNMHMQGLSGPMASPTSRAQAALNDMGIARSGQLQVLAGGSRGLAGLGLGSAADRAACMGVTGAVGAGFGIAQGQHQASGGGDQGWTSAIAFGAAASQIGSSLCNLIDQPVAPSAPPGTAPGYGAPTQYPPQQAASEGVPTWALAAGGLAVAGVLGYLLLK